MIFLQILGSFGWKSQKRFWFLQLQLCIVQLHTQCKYIEAILICLVQSKSTQLVLYYCRNQEIAKLTMGSNTSFSYFTQMVSLKIIANWKMSNDFFFFFSNSGHRTEQDLYVRLVDSVTRQVRFFGNISVKPTVQKFQDFSCHSDFT